MHGKRVPFVRLQFDGIRLVFSGQDLLLFTRQRAAISGFSKLQDASCFVFETDAIESNDRIKQVPGTQVTDTNLFGRQIGKVKSQAVIFVMEFDTHRNGAIREGKTMANRYAVVGSLVRGNVQRAIT